MKFAFATCVQLGRSVIEKIYELGGDFEFFVSLKDEKGKQKSGRIYLDDIAQIRNVPLIKIDNINDPKVMDAVERYKIDWFFIIGWSQIVKKELLKAPQKGCIGMHPTLLPEGRGRASIPWAILKGLDKTGVTMFRLDEGVDTGDILGQVEIMLHRSTTATELYRAVTNAHTILIEKYWKDIAEDTLNMTHQDESRATEWEGRHPEDGELKQEMKIDEAERLVRAVTHPYPGAFYYESGKKITIWKARKTMVKEEGSLGFVGGYLVPEEMEIEDR